MSCFSSSHFPTSYQAVYTAEEAVLSVNAGQDITAAYEQFRSALWAVIEVANDAHAFELSWNTLDTFGKARLLDYQATGNPDSLARLKDCVRSAVETMP